MDALLGLLVVVVLGALIVRALVDFVTVHDYERGLRYQSGRFRGLVSAGTHPVLKPLGEIRVLDGRPTWQLLEAQEVPTADGIALKVSVAARYVVGDPVAAITGDQDHRTALYLQLQLGLREVVSTRTFDEALASRAAMGPEIADHCGLPLARVGIELLEVQVRDLIVPAELRRAYAGVVAARKEGEIALERARAETAALRSLANAGRMLEDHPGLRDLRVLQQLGGSSGNTVMLGWSDSRGGGSGRGDASGSPATAGDTEGPVEPALPAAPSDAAAAVVRARSRGRPRTSSGGSEPG